MSDGIEMGPTENNDRPEEACGVFGIWGPDLPVANLTYLGLYALQHRGQESAGIAVSDRRDVYLHKDMGLVPQVFNAAILEKLQGDIAIGHVRYSTNGASLPVNAQPLRVRYKQGVLALAHNGNLVNAPELRRTMEGKGHIFQTTVDSEVIASLIAQLDAGSVEDAVLGCMGNLQGSYALVLLTKDKLIGVRDPYGIRPLSLGSLDGNYVLASETCALDAVGAEFMDDVAPGEMVVIDGEGLRRRRLPSPGKESLCVFEHIYFARPDSDLDGRNVHLVRKQFGAQLAREHPVEADIVFPVPDSGMSAAIGYAEASDIPFTEGIIKNRYVGRTFIQPKQDQREAAVRIKLNPIRQVLAGKRVVVVDDSIVRGTTSAKIVRMIREAGATEVHLRISSPPVRFACHFGIDTKSSEELVAAGNSPQEVRKLVGADSLGYLSEAGMFRAAGLEPGRFCAACFDGRYPFDVEPWIKNNKYILEND
ncbi:MAG: amidophosphoribosyltransferase [bacterium]|jgi:amidophosphoribosyltransferase